MSAEFRDDFESLVGESDPFGDPPPGEQRGGKKYAAELPLTGLGVEREIADKVLARMERFFTVEREVRGPHCSGRMLKVDAIVRPRSVSDWRESTIAFAIEFKRPTKRATNEYTRWIAQAVDYTHIDWPQYGRLPVLTCPGAASWLDAERNPGAGASGVAERLASQLNVGELVMTWGYGLAIKLHGAMLWTERHGVGPAGRNWSVGTKSGHR